MADQMVIPWDQVGVDETVTEADQAASNDISNKSIVGWTLCTVEECTAFENSMKAYTCNAANLKMRIDKVLRVEQPVLDNKGQQIKRNGEVLQKVMVIPADKLDAINALYTGRFVFDTINLAHPSEKDGMKNRRLFVAKRLGLITPQSTVIPAMAWAGAPRKQVIVMTEWNSYTDKAGDPQKNVKVAWAGYDYASNAAVAAGNKASEETTAAGAAKTEDKEEFDI